VSFPLPAFLRRHVPQDWRDPEYRRGAREMAEVVPGIAAWGLITGVAMAQALPLPIAVLMSLLVFAGSAQLATIPLLAAGAPTWVVWLTAICVNLRFVIFSYGWRPYFIGLPLAQRLRLGYVAGDLAYVLFLRRFTTPQTEPQAQVPYFRGGAHLNWWCWQIPSLAGIFLAGSIPLQWGLGFAGTLALLGVAASLLAGRATVVTAVVAGAAAVAAYAVPFKLNIVVAVAAAVAVGVLLDHSTPRPAQPLDDKT
jgi:predicted branched-subunit amino acid permease